MWSEVYEKKYFSSNATGFSKLQFTVDFFKVRPTVCTLQSGTVPHLLVHFRSSYVLRGHTHRRIDMITLHNKGASTGGLLPSGTRHPAGKNVLMTWSAPAPARNPPPCLGLLHPPSLATPLCEAKLCFRFSPQQASQKFAASLHKRPP